MSVKGIVCKKLHSLYYSNRRKEKENIPGRSPGIFPKPPIIC